MQDSQQVMNNVKKWAIETGNIQLSYFRNINLHIEQKSTEADLVTEADKRCEEYLLGQITTHYPNHSILSEESGVHDNQSEYLWVVDPLDGTNNFAHGIPIFAVSIGLMHKGETILGVVYNPITNQLFKAIKDEGAYLNDEKIRVGQKDSLSECIIASGFPYDRATHPDNNANYFSHLVPKVRGLRRLGSAAYDLCCVAAGILDGYWELNISDWDVTAGTLIVEEAAGKVLEWPNKRGVSIIAGNPYVSNRLLEEFNHVNN